MKTRVFTFILLALTMISYSSCSSDDPLNDDETELTWEEKFAIAQRVAESINGNTYRCEELNSEFEVISAGKPHETFNGVLTQLRFTGDVKLGSLISADGLSSLANCSIEGYYITIPIGGYMPGKNTIFKYISKDVIEGVYENSYNGTKGIWKRVK